MYRKKNPKNKNITVRFNQRNHRLLNEIAHSHDLSVSEWANHLLLKHKNSYGKTENKEELILGINLTLKNLEFMYEVLEKLQDDYKTYYNKTAPLALTKIEITRKMIEMKKLKKKLLK